MDLAALRREYALAGLRRADLDPDPLRQFEKWFAINAAAPSGEPNAMTLATVGANGAPSSRTVLLKKFDGDGFCFFTNYESRKGRDIAANPRVSLTFHWYAQERQVNIEGRATRTSREESRIYFASRPRGSRFGAMVSTPQSAVIPDRAFLEARLRELEERYAGNEPPLPDAWGGFCVRPTRYEFWQGRPNRLHDRFQYRRAESAAPDAPWIIERLAP
ncbi:MAG: pyridoxamine 5'-phosphate oxidase [Verrucomicrobia bacterium]|nr:pyridoxamine 5'-phosphate oxidase [Verrucomicrobiota bacterium]